MRCALGPVQDVCNQIKHTDQKEDEQLVKRNNRAIKKIN